MILRYIFIIFVAIFYVLNTNAQWKCDQIFLPLDKYHGFIENQERFLNVDIDGRPFYHSIAPVYHDMKIEIEPYQSRISEVDRMRVNRSIQTKTRIALDSEIFFAGLNVNESWFFYLQRYYLQLMNHLEVVSRDDKELNYFIIGLKQVLQKPPEIKMMSSPGAFSSENGDHRIAKTTGLPMSPIYFNVDLLDKIDSLIGPYRKPLVPDNLPQGFAVIADSPFQIHVQPEFHEQIVKDRTTKNRLLKLTTIYFHELGHYLGIKDDPQHTLDRLANKASQLLIQGYEQLTLEHRQLKGFEVVKFDLQNQSQIIVFDAFRMINLTPEISAEIKNKKILGSWTIKNLRWGERQTENPFYMSAPEILNFDVVIKNKNEVIVLPFSYVFNLQITKQNLLSHRHRGDLAYRGPVQLKTFFSHVSYERINYLNDIVPQLITQMTSVQKNDLRTGEKLLTTSMFDLPVDFGDPVDIQVEFYNQMGIQSSHIQRSHFLANQNRIEHIGVHRILVHSELNISEKIPSGNYRISRIILKNKQNIRLNYQPITNQDIRVRNDKVKGPRLLYYGPTFTEFLGYQKSRLIDIEHRMKIDLFDRQPYGAILPIAFFAEHLNGIQDIQIDGYMLGTHLDQTKTEMSYPLHIHESTLDKHMMIDHIELKTKGNVTQVIVFLKIPRKVNQDFTSELRIQTLFIRDRNNQELYVDVPMTFGLNK